MTSTQPIVTGVDGSGEALDAVRWAGRHARLHGVPLEVLHALDFPALLAGGVVPPPEEMKDVLRAHGRRCLRAAREIAEAHAAAQRGLPGLPRAHRFLTDRSPHADGPLPHRNRGREASGSGVVRLSSAGLTRRSLESDESEATMDPHRGPAPATPAEPTSSRHDRLTLRPDGSAGRTTAYGH